MRRFFILSAIRINLLLRPLLLCKALNNSAEFTELELDAPLRECLNSFRTSLYQTLATFREISLENAVNAEKKAWKAWFTGMSESSTPLTFMANWANEKHVERECDLARLQGCLEKKLQPLLLELPSILEIALEDRYRLPQKEDRFFRTIKKQLVRVLRRVTFCDRPKRKIPVKKLGEMVFLLNLHEFEQQMEKRWWRTRLQILADAHQFLLEQKTKAEAETHLFLRLDNWLRTTEDDLTRLVETCLALFEKGLLQAGTYVQPLASVSVSRMIPQLKKSKTDQQQRYLDAKRVLLAAQQTVLLRGEVNVITQAILSDLNFLFTNPVDRIASLLERWQGDLEAVFLRITKAGVPPRSEVESWFRNLSASDFGRELENLSHALITSCSEQALVGRFRRELSRISERFEILDFEAVLDAEDPFASATTRIRLREVVGDPIIDTLLPAIEEEVQRAVMAFQSLQKAFEEIPQIILHAAESESFTPAATDELRVSQIEAFQEAVGRARGRLQRQSSASKTLLDGCRTSLNDVRQATISSIEVSLVQKRIAVRHRLSVRSSHIEKLLTNTTKLVHRLQQRILKAIFATNAQMYAWIYQTIRKMQEIKVRISGRTIHALDGKWTHSWSHLPKFYQSLFQPTSLRDKRFFVGHDSGLVKIADAEQKWRLEKAENVLIVGERGSGRSSIINIMQHEIFGEDVLRLREGFSYREKGLLPILATRLRCDANIASVVSHLKESPRIIIVDDLEEWILPGHAGAPLLRELFEMIDETKGKILWVATVNADALSLLKDTLPLNSLFSVQIDLVPFTADQIRSLIKVRQAVTGLTLTFEKMVLNKGWFGRSRCGDERGIFERLTLTSRGNVSVALSLWLEAVKMQNEGELYVRASAWIDTKLGTVEHNATTMALLSLIIRFGPFSEQALEDVLGLDHWTVTQAREVLIGAGILIWRDVRGECFLEVPKLLRPLLIWELRNLGVLNYRECGRTR